MTNLKHECGNPDSYEERVSVQASDYIPLPVNLPGIYLIKQSHHDERVENHSEMNGRSRAVHFTTIINIQKSGT